MKVSCVVGSNMGWFSSAESRKQLALVVNAILLVSR
jgi:hypothetical protein